jgi:hypothetical protein
MAELGMYMLTSLLGAGYLLNSHKQKRDVKDSIMKTQHQPTVGTNVYNSRDYYKGREHEEGLVRKNWEDAKNPIETGIIPMYYNTLHIVQDAEKVPNKDYQSKLIYDVVKHLDPAAQKQIKKHQGSAIHDIDRKVTPDWGIVMDRPKVDRDSNDPLSQIGGGLVPDKEDFTHNNMVPFYSGSITQDTRLNNRSKDGKLELYTGQFKLNAPQKQECALFFKPTKGLTNIYGAKEQRDLSRYNPNNTGKKNNEVPFEKVYVGPGLNQGFTNKPSGGFHNTVRIMPKGIEQLRVDPVLETKGRVKSGKSVIGKRGLIAQMYKNRPELLVENKKGERNFTTVGAVRGRTLRPNVILRDTNRKKSRCLITPAKAAAMSKPRIAPKTRSSRRQNFCGTPFRNAGTTVNQVNDYGKSGYRNRVNNRAVTGTRTHITGTKGPDAAKKRLYDKPKKTRKQHYVHHSRTYGYAGPQKPGAAPAYNPHEWVAKATIRETTEDLNHLGVAGLVGGGQGTAYDPNDYAARTTIRETTENNKHEGWIGTISGGGAKTYNMAPARTTIRETTENNRHLGGHSGIRKKHIAYDPNDRARTTIRETTENNKHIGIAGAPIHKKHIVYDPNDRARTTIRETTERNNHLGGASGKKKHISQNQDRARTTIRETTERNNHIGNVSRLQSQSGKGYMTNKYKAKNTNRQFTSDHEYTGIANANNRKLKSYDDAYNARLNINKEKVAKGRRPMGGGPRLGHQEINMEIKKIDSDRTNQYSAMKTSTIGNVFNPNVTLTSERNHLPQHEIRLDTGILDAFKQNPLTQSLQSWA